MAVRPAKPFFLWFVTAALLASGPVAVRAGEAETGPKALGAMALESTAMDLLAAEGFDPGQSAGLFVGINRFRDERVAPLKYAVDDAIDFADCLQLCGLVPASRIRLGLAGEPVKEESRERLARLLALGMPEPFTPTRGELLRELSWVSRSAGKAGLLVMSYSSHGYYHNADAVLCEDSTLDQELSNGILQDSSLTHQRILTMMQNSECPRKLVLLDACREKLQQGTRSLASESGLPSSVAKMVAEASGMAVLLSTSTAGYGYDGGTDENGLPIHNGVFTHYFLQGLRQGEAGDERGYVTVRTLSEYAESRMRVWVAANRPEDLEKTTGIEKRFDGAVETMPLALNRDTFQRMREQTQRVDAMKQKLREWAVAGLVPIPDALALGEGLGKLSGAEASLWLERLEALGDPPDAAALGRFLADWRQHVAASQRTMPPPTTTAPPPPTASATAASEWVALEQGLSYRLKDGVLCVRTVVKGENFLKARSRVLSAQIRALGLISERRLAPVPTDIQSTVKNAMASESASSRFEEVGEGEYLGEYCY
jgi:hypothetical protein